MRSRQPDYNIETMLSLIGGGPLGIEPRIHSASILLIFFALATHGDGAAGSENVLLVVNDWSDNSRAIATHYAERRRIPPANVCHIATGDRETVDRVTFVKEIETPIAQCLTSRKLTEKILYLVTTLGVPLRLSGPGERMQAQVAAVDSELTLLYGRMKGENYPVAGPLANPFYRQRNVPFEHRSFPIYLVTRLTAYTADQAKAMIDRGLAARDRGRFVIDLRDSDDEEGNNWLRTAAMLLPKDRVVFDESSAVLMKQRDVIGYASWGSNDKHRKQRRLQNQWLPGAITMEFVSSSGRTFRRPPDTWNIGPWDPSKYWYGSPQSLSADYIEEGATGANGHTDEPFLFYCARPDYVLPAYFSGRNLAESYYLGMPALSWMNIVIGDPLVTLAKPKPSRP